MPRPKKTDECKCGMLGRMAEDPGDPIKFDLQLNEYHIERQGNGGYSLIHFCPFCGGALRNPNAAACSTSSRAESGSA
jgi:hypothetical protein